MRSWKPWALLIIVVLGLSVPALAVIDRQLGRGGPAPEDYYRELTSMGRYGGVRCAQSDGVSLARLGGQQLHYIYPGAGADTFIAGTGMPFVTYDFDSGRTGEDHDLLVVAGVRPERLAISREGPHLLICGVADAIELVIVRQYCYGDSPEGPWNNQYEEIIFPAAKEIWLTDELYDHYNGPDDLFSVSRIADVKQLKSNVTRAPESWHVRAFSDALPSDWFASWACRHDLE